MTLTKNFRYSSAANVAINSSNKRNVNKDFDITSLPTAAKMTPASATADRMLSVPSYRRYRSPQSEASESNNMNISNHGYDDGGNMPAPSELYGSKATKSCKKSTNPFSSERSPPANESDSVGSSVRNRISKGLKRAVGSRKLSLSQPPPETDPLDCSNNGLSISLGTITTDASPTDPISSISDESWAGNRRRRMQERRYLSSSRREMDKTSKNECIVGNSLSELKQNERQRRQALRSTAQSPATLTVPTSTTSSYGEDNEGERSLNSEGRAPSSVAEAATAAAAAAMAAAEKGKRFDRSSRTLDTTTLSSLSMNRYVEVLEDEGGSQLALSLPRSRRPSLSTSLSGRRKELDIVDNPYLSRPSGSDSYESCEDDVDEKTQPCPGEHVRQVESSPPSSLSSGETNQSAKWRSSSAKSPETSSKAQASERAPHNDKRSSCSNTQRSDEENAIKQSTGAEDDLQHNHMKTLRAQRWKLCQRFLCLVVSVLVFIVAAVFVYLKLTSSPPFSPARTEYDVNGYEDIKDRDVNADYYPATQDSGYTKSKPNGGPFPLGGDNGEGAVELIDPEELRYLLIGWGVDEGLLDDPMTPQHHAFLWLVEIDRPTKRLASEPGLVDIALRQRFSLATFYFSTSGPYTNFTHPFDHSSWNLFHDEDERHIERIHNERIHKEGVDGLVRWLSPNRSECEWAGVTCYGGILKEGMNEETGIINSGHRRQKNRFLRSHSGNDRRPLTTKSFAFVDESRVLRSESPSVQGVTIQAINLQKQNLVGVLPSVELTFLLGLRFLDLSGNSDVHGTVPESLCQREAELGNLDHQKDMSPVSNALDPFDKVEIMLDKSQNIELCSCCSYNDKNTRI